MNPLRRVWLSFLVLFSCALLVAPLAIANSQTGSDCVLTWASAPGPPPPISGSYALNGIAARSSDDVWAVGQTGDSTFIEHWDGEAWTIIPSPSVIQSQNWLLGVVALAADDAWAVGYSHTPDDQDMALALHWDGVEWKIITLPLPPGNSRFLSIAGTTSDDIWAVGSQNGGPFGMHWDGSQWAQVEFPTAGELLRVIAFSEKDAWVMSSGSDIVELLFWNGVDWLVATRIELDNYFPVFSEYVHDMLVLTPDDIWVVGIAASRNSSGGLIWHWDGNVWAKEATSKPQIGIAGVSSDHLWTVGGANYTSATNLNRWDGGQWTTFFPGHTSAGGITAVSNDEFWVVGASMLHGTLPCKEPPSEIPTTLEPTNDVVVATAEPAFDWSDAADTSSYTFQVYFESPDGEPVVEWDTEVSEFTYDGSPVLDNGHYLWRVRACNYVGCGVWSDFGSFVMDVPPPTELPTLQTPENGAILATWDITFEWGNAPYSTHYNLELYRGSLEGRLLFTGSNSVSVLYPQFDLFPEGEFVWRVNACNPGGCGEWSEPFTFTVSYPPPLVAKLIRPEKGSTFKPPQDFYWQQRGFVSYAIFEVRRETRRGRVVTRVRDGNGIIKKWGEGLPEG